jgi:hypothetical protein
MVRPSLTSRRFPSRPAGYRFGRSGRVRAKYDPVTSGYSDGRVAAELAASSAWTLDAWLFVVIHRTERLIRSESFRRLHRRVVAEREDLGDTGTLSRDELPEVLEPARVPAIALMARS